MLKIKNCPLCKASNYVVFSKLKKNLYSEILSKILKVEENYLIKKIKNNQCNNCGLIFKNYWFSEKVLEGIYNNYIIGHPRGQDFKSKLFSKDGLKNTYKKLLDANQNNDEDLINKYSRTIKSIIFSIPKFNKLRSTSWINKSSRSFDSSLNFNLLKKNFKKILSLIEKPVEFKRFSGFESGPMWSYLKSNTKLNSYGEIGCPQWGLFELAKRSKVKTFFIKRKEKNFWGKKCRLKNKNCVIFKKEKVGFVDLNYEDLLKKKFKIDLIGVYQYLDHVRDPYTFLENLDKISKSQAYIVDNYKNFDNTVYIQHFTGWNKKTFAWVAKKFKKKILNNFRKIKKTENDLYLFI